MIEEGIVALVQADPAVSLIAPVGGFYVELPKDFRPPSWSWTNVSGPASYHLRGKSGPNTRRIQIDCFGDPNRRGTDAIALAAAIDKVLSGFSGLLPDADQTMADGIFQSDLIDFFDDVGRTYRRMLEYEVNFI